jgi:hypothetical protein
MAVGEAFPIGPAFLLAKSSFPSLKTSTVFSQQELGNPVGKAFANRVGVFASSLALSAKHAFPVVVEGILLPGWLCFVGEGSVLGGYGCCYWGCDISSIAKR